MKYLYARAIGKWGEGAQIDCAIEEMAELTVELIHHRRGRENVKLVAEEIADVRIMLDQLEHIFVCGKEVEESRRAKLERLERRVAK